MRRRQGQMKGKSKDKRTEGGRGEGSRESEQMEACDDGEMRGLRKKKSRSDGEINRVVRDSRGRNQEEVEKTSVDGAVHLQLSTLPTHLRGLIFRIHSLRPRVCS